MLYILFKNKIYKIKKEKLLQTLSKLNNKSIKEDEITTLMQKYKLYDEDFLENINKI